MGGLRKTTDSAQETQTGNESSERRVPSLLTNMAAPGSLWVLCFYGRGKKTILGGNGADERIGQQVSPLWGREWRGEWRPLPCLCVEFPSFLSLQTPGQVTTAGNARRASSQSTTHDLWGERARGGGIPILPWPQPELALLPLLARVVDVVCWKAPPHRGIPAPAPGVQTDPPDPVYRTPMTRHTELESIQPDLFEPHPASGKEGGGGGSGRDPNTCKVRGTLPGGGGVPRNLQKYR